MATASRNVAVTLLLLTTAGALGAPAPVLKRSDVVFMYQASRDVYQEYGATVLAWGGKPTPKSLQESQGVRFFGSVGMVTEFSRYYERFPDSYERGLCRDVHGQPVKVPWLTDHQHKGIPYWWCCTRQPLFREYLRERVVETIQAGAHGLHIDDHMGSAGGLWLGLCFCDLCVEGFGDYLTGLAPDQLQRRDIEPLNTFNYRDHVRSWLAEDPSKQRKPTQHPLWNHWTAYQCRASAGFMEELRELAAHTAGHAVPVGANAGLLWPRHLADYKSLDLFSAETDHHAERHQFSDLPLFAYRLADAVGRPYASTASGGDWAHVKERNLPGLVRTWIALSYAAGHSFMAPHRQWCYTPDKGTHWYQGPSDKFAPLYRFVRRHSKFFDDYETYADVAVVLPHRSFIKEPNRWFQIGQQLAAKNFSYRLILAGDEIVDHPLKPEDFASSTALLVPDREQLLPADRRLLEDHTRSKRTFTGVPEVLAAIQPAIQIDPEHERTVRLLPRVKSGAFVIHLVNTRYEVDRDDVLPVTSVRLRVNTNKLGLPETTACSFITPGGETRSLPLKDGAVVVPELGLWGLVTFNANR